MKFEEFIAIVGTMKSVWTRPEFLPDEYAVKTWYALLEDLPVEYVKAAVHKLAQTNNFPPTVAEIRGGIVDMQTGDTSWSDGWESARTAVRRFGYMNEAEALESMDEITRAAVKRLGYQIICQSEQDEQVALRANFRMIYTEIKERAKDDAQLSDELKALIGHMKGNKKLLE